jgi:hypothetical protein
MWNLSARTIKSLATTAVLGTTTLLTITNATPALADLVFSTREIVSIASVGVGSTTIGGVVVNADASQWLQNSTQGLLGAKWQFNNNGTFVFYLPNTRTDLYPIQGNFQIQGKKLSFLGSRIANTSVSIAKSFVGGTVDFNQNPPVMRIQWGTSNINAAVVNNTSFGSNKNSAYDATVILDWAR